MDPIMTTVISIAIGIFALVFLATFAAAFLVLMGPPDTFDIEIESERLEQTTKEKSPTKWQ
jgi:hypothetical protein